MSVNGVPFPIVDWRIDPHWPVKTFFNYVCEQGALADALESIIQRYAYAYNEEYFFFPDRDDPDPSFHFDGVTFGVSDEEVIINDQECCHYARQAAQFCLERNILDAVTFQKIARSIPS
jgi:hypothetical protein